MYVCIAGARCAFQVSQGSVETLFRWGGKRLHDFAANWFRKLCTKFRSVSPEFCRRYYKNILVSFYGHMYNTQDRKVCMPMSHGVLGYGESNGVTAIFVTW